MLCFRVLKVLHVDLVGPALFTVEIDFPVSHPALGLPGEMGFLIRRPRSVRRRNATAVSCLCSQSRPPSAFHSPQPDISEFLAISVQR